MVNFTCPVETAPQDPVPFYQDGKLNFKAHDVGWIVSGFFALIASCSSFWLIWKHITYYSCPQQQRHIVRMLFMVPIYAVISWASYFWYHEAIYYQTIRDCYEAVVVTSFFYLLLQYIADTPAEQTEVFRMVHLKKWVWPLGWWKYRPTGLHFLWLMKICILQYALVRPICTLAAVGLQYFGRYCLESWMPWFGHVYLVALISVSVTVAMYCLIQFYMPVRKELDPYKPVLKFLAVKSVVFLTFWQDSFLSLLVAFGAIKPAQYMTAAEIQVGINALLATFEMVVFGFLHIKAFSYLPYRPADRSRTTKRWAALLDTFNYSDWFSEMKATSRYVVARRRGREWTYVDGVRREKYDHLQRALGRERYAELERERLANKRKQRTFWKDPHAAAAAAAEEEDDELRTQSAGTAMASDRDLEKGDGKTDGAAAATDAAPRPQGNRALRPDFDPEKDTGDLEGPAEEEQAEQDPREEDELLRGDRREPTLPKLDYRPRAARGSDAHPELSWYHGAGRVEPVEPSSRAQPSGATAVGPGRGQGEEEPRRAGNDGSERARRQGSGSLYAWWRTIAGRFSASQGAAMHGDEAAKEGEADGMLAEERAEEAAMVEIGRTSDLGAVDAGASIESSPLGRFIAGHAHLGDEPQEPRQPLEAGEVRPSPIIAMSTARPARSALVRQASAAKSDRGRIYDAPSPAPHQEVTAVSREELARPQVPAAHEPTAFPQSASGLRVVDYGAQRAPPPQSSPPQPFVASPPPGQGAVDEATASASSNATIRQHALKGPKGRKISLVLPTPLNPDTYEPAERCVPAPSSQTGRPTTQAPASRAAASPSAPSPPSHVATDVPSEMMRANGPRHRVVLGNKSLAQVRAEEQASRRAEELAELEEARRARRERDEGERREAQERHQAETERRRRGETVERQRRERDEQKRRRDRYEEHRAAAGAGAPGRGPAWPRGAAEEAPSPSPPSIASGETASRRSRRLSAPASATPAAPRPSELLAVQPPTTVEKKWWGKKKVTPEPYTPLPAPSQLATDVGDVKDAFTAAGLTAPAVAAAASASVGDLADNNGDDAPIRGRPSKRHSLPATRSHSAQAHAHAPAGPLHPGLGSHRGGSGSSFEVGAIVSRYAVAAAAPGPWVGPSRAAVVPRPYPPGPGMPTAPLHHGQPHGRPSSHGYGPPSASPMLPYHLPGPGSGGADPLRPTPRHMPHVSSLPAVGVRGSAYPYGAAGMGRPPAHAPAPGMAAAPMAATPSSSSPSHYSQPHPHQAYHPHHSYPLGAHGVRPPPPPPPPPGAHAYPRPPPGLQPWMGGTASGFGLTMGGGPPPRDVPRPGRSGGGFAPAPTGPPRTSAAQHGYDAPEGFAFDYID